MDWSNALKMLKSGCRMQRTTLPDQVIRMEDGKLEQRIGNERWQFSPDAEDREAMDWEIVRGLAI